MQDFSLARRTMVDNQLRPEGVTDRGVLAAMGTVERERFVPRGGPRRWPISIGRSGLPRAGP